MWRHIASNALTLFVIVLIAFGGVIGWGKNQFSNAGPLEQAICVQVPSGHNMRRLSEDLLARSAIENGSIFRLGADYLDKSNQLKAGSFLVPASASMAEIVDIVTRGGASTCGTEIVYRIGISRSALQLRELDPVLNRFVDIATFQPGIEAEPSQFAQAKANGDTRYRIALAEGVTSWQIMEALNAADFLTIEALAIPDEGSLAPDSYEVTAGHSLSELVAEMMQRQQDRLADAWRERADDLPVNTPQEALVLASIIEKETGLADERRQVASVFINRLNRGMRLQTDPTVIYGITEGRAPLGRGLRQSELRRETPYNTYVITGLPPTPIANPGLASIQAALDPAATDYLFFVADGTGGHAFAETLAEHNRNVSAWRAIEAEAQND